MTSSRQISFPANPLRAVVCPRSGVVALGALAVTLLVAGMPPRLPAAPNAASASDAPKTAKGAAGSGPAADELDRQLLDDLSSDLLDGLGDSQPQSGKGPMPGDPEVSGKPSPSPSPPADRPETESPGPGQAGRGQADPGQADPGQSNPDPSGPADPLKDIGRRMHGVEQRIAQRDTSATTQDLQREIVADLSTLIDQLQQQCQSASQSRSQGKQGAQGKQGGSQTGGEGSQSADQAASDPARESSERLGTSKLEETEGQQMRDVVKQVWGHLPARVRDLMRSATIEEFLPQYERQIEAYYRRLAEDGE